MASACVSTGTERALLVALMVVVAMLVVLLTLAVRAFS
jgi:hypothetical protein